MIFIYWLLRQVATRRNDAIFKGWQIQIVKNWAPTNLANIGHQNKTLKQIFKKRKDFF